MDRMIKLFLLLDFLAYATCQSSSGSEIVASVPISASFPDEGNVESFADMGTTSPPPPPYGAIDGYQSPTDGRSPNGLEILVAIFFFVAAAWLLVAVFYALLALLVLRLRAQGRLDLSAEHFGRFYVPGTRLYIPCGCVLRRYVLAFGHDQEIRHNRSTDHRSMSRGERRSAIENILIAKIGYDPKLSRAEEEIGSFSQQSHTSDSSHGVTKALQENGTPSDHSQSQSSDEPVCSICLAEYDQDDCIFHSGVCDHMYHTTCILDWLERRSNTDCPCCRRPLVSEEDVWEAVKRARKSKQKQGKKMKSNGRWRFTPLASETSAQTSRNTASRNRESRTAPSPRETQHPSSISPPSTEDESRRDLSVESNECGAEDVRYRSAMDEQASQGDPIAMEEHEAAVYVGSEELDEETGIGITSTTPSVERCQSAIVETGITDEERREA